MFFEKYTRGSDSGGENWAEGMILMIIPHLKIGISPLVEMLRVKTFHSTLWPTTRYYVTWVLSSPSEAAKEDDIVVKENFSF